MKLKNVAGNLSLPQNEHCPRSKSFSNWKRGSEREKKNSIRERERYKEKHKRER